MNRLFAVALLTAAVLVLPSLAQAGDKPAETPKAEKKAKGMPFNGTVSAVDRVAKTVTLEGKEKQRVFQVTSETKIFKNKKPATFDDILAGERVGGYVRENADGKSELITLNTGLAPKNEKSKAKEGEKKPAN